MENFEAFLFSKLTHLGKFYNSKEEFIAHLKSGDVTIPIPDVIKYADEYYGKEVIDFGVYLENLEPLNKVTVHAPDGSGMGTGLYYKTIEHLYKDYKAQSQTK